MDNNKNRMKDRETTSADLRKMQPKDYEDKGIINGHKIGVHDENDHEKKS